MEIENNEASIYLDDEDNLELIKGDDILSDENVVFRIADGHTIINKRERLSIAQLQVFTQEITYGLDIM